MKTANFFSTFSWLRTELNVISRRYGILQLDRLLTISGQLNQGRTTLPDIEPKSIDTQSYSPTASNIIAGATLESSTDPDIKVASNHRSLSVIEVLPGEKIRVIFIVISPEIWPSIEPIWTRALKDNRFIVSIVVLESNNPEMSLTSLSRAKALFESTATPYFTEQNFSLENYRPHVVFYSLPYGSLYPESYKPEVVSAMGCRIAYVPYGLEVGGGVFNARYQYDSEVPRVAWRIFARSPSQLVSFSRYCSYGNGHVVVTGHPRSETDRSLEIRWHRIIKEKARGRSVILWTPHFSVLTRRKWSSFLDHHETILRLIDNRSDCFLVVRPHPFLLTSLAKHEGWGHERVSAWFGAIDGKENVHVDTETDYRPAFEISSALIADAGSFLVEYLRTGKPVCHLTGKDDIGLNEEVRSLACFYPGATEIDIAAFLDRVIKKGGDSLTEARKSALQTYFGVHNQTPSQSILDEISNSISNKLPRIYSAELPTSRRHNEAFQYWLKATSTFLAPETYYLEQDTKLREILSRHAKGRFAADIGCGNGRFTQVISEYFEFTEATDPNEQLICEARELALKAGITNISYAVERLEHAESLTTYDFVSCMDVTSGLIDDEEFIKSIWKLKAAMRLGAKLLLKETLNLVTPELIERNGYKAVYRSVRSYLQAFEAVGLFLEEELLIAQDLEKSRIASFYVFSESKDECR